MGTHAEAKIRVGLASGIAIASLVATLSTARADPSPADVAAAQKAFDEGMALMDAKRFAEACPRLEESQRLDPGMGTQFRLAECLEAAGSTGSAWRLFGEVAKEADRAGRADRRAQATERRVALERRVPWLRLKLPAALSAAPGLVVTRDGQPVPPSELGRLSAVDPGTHVVNVAATGKKPWQGSFRALEGGTVELVVPALEDAPQAQAEKPVLRPKPDPDDPGLEQKIIAVVVGGVGLTGIGVGIGLGLVASASWDDALGGCQDQSPTRCGPDAIAAGEDASTFATISTVGFVVGGVAVAASPVIWLLAPSAPSAGVSGIRFIPSSQGLSLRVEGVF